PWRDQGRDHPARGEHAAHIERLRIHALRQPRQGARRLGAVSAEVRAALAHSAVPATRHRLGRRRIRSHSVGGRRRERLATALAIGATAVLMAERATPTSVFKRLAERKPTIFYGVPTLYGAMLASPEFPKEESLTLRLCVSAGEALPADMGRRWKEKTGVDIL